MVHARVFCSHNVRARVVLTSEAPAHAAAPPRYVADVRARLVAHGNTRDATALEAAYLRRPLSGGASRDAVIATETGLCAAEVAFSGLGWVSFACREHFSLCARPVEGAAAHWRAPMYAVDELLGVTAETRSDSPLPPSGMP